MKIVFAHKFVLYDFFSMTGSFHTSQRFTGVFKEKNHEIQNEINTNTMLKQLGVLD